MATLGGVRDVSGNQNSLAIDGLARFAVEEHNKKQVSFLFLFLFLWLFYYVNFLLRHTDDWICPKYAWFCKYSIWFLTVFSKTQFIFLIKVTLSLDIQWISRKLVFEPRHLHIVISRYAHGTLKKRNLISTKITLMKFSYQIKISPVSRHNLELIFCLTKLIFDFFGE